MIAKHLRQHWPLWLALLVGVALRIALWGNLPRIGFISDEAEYLAAADWLAHRRGFAWHTSYLWTRAPLYPLFLAAHLAIFGRALESIFFSQTLLSLLNVALIYAIGRKSGSSPGYAGGAAFLGAVALPLAIYPQLLLSETLFITLLLGAVLLLVEPGQRWRLIGGGILLGLATLTRGLLLGFLPLVALWLIWQAGGDWRQRVTTALIPLLMAGMLIGPWALYASRTYGGLIIIDTTGAYNLALGARTAYDGGRSDAPTRNFTLALLDPTLDDTERAALVADSCLAQTDDPGLNVALTKPVTAITQAERQRLLNAEGWCLIWARPWAFVSKTLVELVDLFQINYSGAERLSEGFALGRLPRWYTLALLALDDTLYILVLPLAVLGWMVARQRGLATGLTVIIGLWLLYNVAVAPLLFAINRFRIPLLPFLFVLAMVALAEIPRWWLWLRGWYGLSGLTLALVLWLIAATPYAYLEPRAPEAPSRWASYFGPYPSAIAAARLAWDSRKHYEAVERLESAFTRNDLAAMTTALADPDLPAYASAFGAPLLAARQGQPEQGLILLDVKQPLYSWQTAVVRGELLRQLGDLTRARQWFGLTLVDDWNPVGWAWRWLHPPRLPADRIDLADDNDLGYIDGFYLGEFDPVLGATVRWATETAHLRFPAAATGEPRQLCLQAAANWPADLPQPTVRVMMGEIVIGTLTPDHRLQEFCLPLPALPAGSDYIVTFTSPGFVPDALDLVRRQGPQVGDLRVLAFQLDWAEVR
ncbi:glycosyltransferase family 39 protein [Chloroflexus sp.]|uniref:glycosyltransferase family 39 protein n=1 Tax=Chloroflexus sp. TaxID=1904827 RepID=UPI00261C67A3|nr:glycosyltransferase family 39 protein [uncultured Chloroflexus sp.]